MKMKKIALLCLFFGMTANAHTLNIHFEKICAFEDDRVMDKVAFVLAADTETMENVQYSKLMNVHPKHCYVEKKNSEFEMTVPLADLAMPLRLQIAEKSLLLYKFGFEKIYIGTAEQLKRTSVLMLPVSPLTKRFNCSPNPNF